MKAEIRATLHSHESARQQRFNELYRSTRVDVLSYLARRARTLEDAADALSETYAAAWVKLDRLPEGDGARLWLFGAARIELLRAGKRESVRDATVASLAEEMRGALSDHYPAIEVDVQLNRAMSQLSLQDQEILRLTAWEDLTPRNIAVVMDLPVNTVRVRLHRSRRRLQRLLSDGLG